MLQRMPVKPINTYMLFLVFFFHSTQGVMQCGGFEPWRQLRSVTDSASSWQTPPVAYDVVIDTGSQFGSDDGAAGGGGAIVKAEKAHLIERLKDKVAS